MRRFLNLLLLYQSTLSQSAAKSGKAICCGGDSVGSSTTKFVRLIDCPSTVACPEITSKSGAKAQGKPGVVMLKSSPAKSHVSPFIVPPNNVPLSHGKSSIGGGLISNAILQEVPLEFTIRTIVTLKTVPSIISEPV